MLSFGRKAVSNATDHRVVASQDYAETQDVSAKLAEAITAIKAGRAPELSALPHDAAEALSDLHQELKRRNRR
jgi:methyl-accepting chemotaxis protein